MSQEKTFPTPASHPSHCTGCNGTGMQEAPDTTSKAAGQDITYHWVRPCTHIWWDDDPNPELFDFTQLQGR